ncbi:MAG: hypothetical protein GTO42_01635 [Candidatus Latescibacteria bacterium]|nr:hypothetical protein [Candidatus Latescibacterota bacterium]NIO27232.1 hypothetical protein [Candidatus Latescibacterota bacterium]NIO54756.1 hypothetical protein [Candidatus Latescibacterota bacterium]NIT00839.1 hypothetical protein [Candidatus Latescibacterota bacterium]NIT37762.1 hypothetical protein [Candidatus Latescibacterota bacterium]
MKIQGAAVGVAREVWETRTEGRFYRSYTEIELSRLGAPLSMFMTHEGVEAADGKPVWFRSEVKASEIGSSIYGEVKNDTVYLKSEGLGYSEESRIPWEEGALGMGSVDWEIRKRLMAGEDEFSLRVFYTETKEFQSLRIVRTGTVEDTVAGVAGEYLQVEQYMGDTDVATLVSLLDEDFLPVKTITHQLAMVIIIERIPNETATDVELESGFDLIKASRIPVPGYPESPERVQDITLRLSFKNPRAVYEALDAPNQKVVSREGNTVDLLLSRGTVTKTSLSNEELEVFLAPDSYIQSNDPAVHSIARKIANDSGKEGWPLATEIAAWVNAHIETKDLGRGFASALEVLESREGDCTEHSVLLASLLRAAGIPARVVSGLAYGGGYLFGHMWTEAYVGYWRTLDALDLKMDPIRIRISASKDAKALSLKDIANDLAMAGGLTVEVVEYHLAEDK